MLLHLRIFASECRWSTAEDMWHPGAMRSTEFWMVCSFLMEDGLALGNQIGAACEKQQLMRAL